MTNSTDSKSFNLKTFSSDVLIYSFGQALLLIFGIVQSLIIPKYLTTTDYGYWQIFLLISTYAGLLHLGFTSGLLVRWAGKSLNEFSEEIPTAFKALILELSLVIILLIPLAVSGDLVPIEIALATLANAVLINLITFFIVIAQSVKQFKFVTKANIVRGSIFLILILAIFSSTFTGYISLIFATLLTYLTILLVYVVHFQKCIFRQNILDKSLLQYLWENIEIGIFVMLGSSISLLIVTVDRVTVGYFFPITQFGIYAFAMSMCGFATVFLQAVAQVFFPYLSGSSDEIKTKTYNYLRSVIVIFWAGLLSAYFPLTVWIRYYLPNYVSSLPLLAILLCTIGFSGLILILHANFFKVYGKQKLYFVLAGLSLAGAVALNILAVFLFGTLIAVAATAVVIFTTWYTINELALRHLVEAPVKEIIRWVLVIGAYIGAFLGTYLLTETWILGFGVYVSLFFGITAVCLRREVEQLWNMIREIVKRKEDV